MLTIKRAFSFQDSLAESAESSFSSQSRVLVQLEGHQRKQSHLGNDGLLVGSLEEDRKILGSEHNVKGGTHFKHHDTERSTLQSEARSAAQESIASFKMRDTQNSHDTLSE